MGLKEKLKEQAAKRFKVEPAQLPEDWEGRDEIFVRKLSAKERDEFELSRRKTRILNKPNGKTEVESQLCLENLRARLLVKTLAAADGQRIFADTDADSIGDTFDGVVADVLYDQAVKFNGLNVDGAEKNASSATNAGCSSASPP